MRLAIVVEGDSEYLFVNRVLSKQLPVSVDATAINLRGGNISIERLQNKVRKIISNFDYTTTLVDYYGFRNPSHTHTVDELEAQLADGLDARRFIPYIQQYEFEALVFADVDLLAKTFAINKTQLENIVFIDTPEDINHNSPPSKLLQSIYKPYIKITDGSRILQNTDWDRLKEKCPRFRAWIDQLSAL